MNNAEPIEKLIAVFRTLPGVGYKTAQRYAYKIINSSSEEAKEFASCIINAKNQIRFCSECGNFTEKPVCKICQVRDAKIICVVSQPKDIIALEKVKNYNGVYHILNGTLSPLENRGPEDLRIKELLHRIEKHKTNEVILATNPDVEGEATAMYVAKLLKPLGIKVSRIAQGISMGTDLEFADEITLTHAMEARRLM